eukprot:TRINITY_DN3039_c0_g1_i1.p1 TRINITY_DN3039_c0_g1~~TRINITY_DN3039_c0_g1_i1.p1  ORF type:complete len:977 (+),score=264.84 TRINITY_DN3039_c0_g1_i1:48-2933(+)
MSVFSFLGGKKDEKQQIDPSLVAQMKANGFDPSENLPPVMSADAIKQLVNNSMTSGTPVSVSSNDLEDPSLLNELEVLMGSVAAGGGGGDDDGGTEVPLPTQIASLKAKISAGKSECIRLKRGGREDEAKVTYIHVTSMVSELKDLELQLARQSSPAASFDPAPVPDPTVAPAPVPTTSLASPAVLNSSTGLPPPPPYAQHAHESPYSSPLNTNRTSASNSELYSSIRSDGSGAPPSYTQSLKHSSQSLTPTYTRTNPTPSTTSSSLLEDSRYSPSPLSLSGGYGVPSAPSYADTPNLLLSSTSTSSLVNMAPTQEYPEPMTPPKEPPVLLVAQNLQPASHPSNIDTAQAGALPSANLLPIVKMRSDESLMTAKRMKAAGQSDRAILALRAYKSLQSATDRINRGEILSLGDIPASYTGEEEESSESESDEEEKMREGGGEEAFDIEALVSEVQQEEASAASIRGSVGGAGVVTAPLSSSEIVEDEMEVDVESPKSTGLTPEVLAIWEAQKNTQFDTLLNYLKKQVTSAFNSAKEYRDVDKEIAIRYLKLKKQWLDDIKTINETRQYPRIPPPLYFFEKTRFEREIVNNDISLHELEVTVLPGTDLLGPGTETKLSLYTVMEFTWPDSNSPQNFTSSPVSVEGPPFNPQLTGTKRFRIERKKSLVRFLKTRKLTLSLFQKKGFFRSDVLLGKANFKLESMLTKSTCLVKAEVVDGRKKTGGILEVRLRLNKPIVSPEKSVVVEKHLFIKKHYSLEDLLQDPNLALPPRELYNPPTAPSSPQVKLQPSAPPSPAPPPSRAPSPPVEEQSAAPTSVATPVQTPTKKKGEKNTQLSQVSPNPSPSKKQKVELPPLPDYESHLWYVSYAVMEDALETLQKQMTAASDMSLRLNLQVKVTVLEAYMGGLMGEIQSGGLTMEAYAKLVQGKIEDEKELAAELDKRGKSKDAAAARKRITLMETELAG